MIFFKVLYDLIIFFLLIGWFLKMFFLIFCSGFFIIVRGSLIYFEGLVFLGGDVCFFFIIGLVDFFWILAYFCRMFLVMFIFGSFFFIFLGSFFLTIFGLRIGLFSYIFFFIDIIFFWIVGFLVEDWEGNKK